MPLKPLLAAACLIQTAAADLLLPVAPRLLFPPSREAEIKQLIQSDPLAKKIHTTLLARAEAALTERTCRYEIPDGRRLLAESRHALHQIATCAMAWRTTGDPRFRDRTLRELDAACALKDWNPSHFLDTAEMATAVAIGLDWLNPTLTLGQKSRYQAALSKALDTLEQRHSETKWWQSPKNNWSQVCGTGMAFAAEMTRELDPARSERIYNQCSTLIEDCIAFYQPDGGYPEGPGYWHYGSNYHILLLAQNRVTDLPHALRRTGEFMMHMTGPTRQSFNFADGSPRTEVPTAAQSWLATTSGDPGQARYVRRALDAALSAGISGKTTSEMRFFPFHLLWLPAEPPAATAPAPLTAIFQGEQPLAFFRTSWETDAAYLAIKGGSGGSSHGQLDAGTFIYDALGVRWFHDLGADNYNLPGYFGKQRWNYFRLTNRAHSTLVINDQLQDDPLPGATLAATPDGGCKIDLTPVYPKQAKAVSRTVSFDQNTGKVTLTDSLDAPTGPVRWAAITKAKPTIRGNTLILTEKGKSITLTRHDSHGGAWQEFPATPPTPAENPNTGVRIIGFTAPTAPSLTLKVSWQPTQPAER